MHIKAEPRALSLRFGGVATLAALLAGCANAPPPPALTPVTPAAAVALEPVARPSLPPTPPPTPVQSARPPAPCSSLVRAAPAYPDSDAALRSTSGIAEHLQLLIAARKLRIERERHLEEALRRCVVRTP